MTTKSPNVGKTERIASTVAGGSLIALSIVRPSLPSILLGGLGAALAYRGLSGRCPVYTKLGVTSAGANTVTFESKVNVRRTRDEAYEYCRNATGIVSTARHFEQVSREEPAHWRLRLPGNRSLDWRAELIADRPGELIEWRSLPGSDVSCSGHVRFEDAADGRGTDVHLLLRYEPDTVAGAIIAKLADGALQRILGDELKRALKQLEATKPRAKAKTASARSGADGFDETAPNYAQAAFAEYDDDDLLGPGSSSGSRPGGGRGGRHDGHHAARRRGRDLPS